MRVGFVGTGAMGRPMARRLIDAGHVVTLWARRPESAEALVAAGAGLAATPRDLAAASEIVLSIITAGADVEAVALGPDGLIEGFRPGSVFVDMSTIAPGEARRIARALAARGVAMLDAPVSGGAVGAAAGTLSIMVGGEAGAIERARPLFDVLGKTVVHVGASGAGQVAKACNQMVMVAAIEACAEALCFAERAGVDPVRARQAMLGGSAASRVLEVFGGRMVERNFVAGVEARLHHKDFGILIQAARELGVAVPLAACVGQQLNALVGLDWGRDDSSRLLSVLERT